jgi:PAS domain S-box-containing protein
MVYEIGFDLVIPGQYLKQALGFSLLSVGVLVGIFFYLNYFTRRPYFTIWAAGWLFYSLWLTLNFSLGVQDDAEWLMMVKQWSLSATALFLLWGGARFLGQRVSQTLAGLFGSFLFVWSYYGAYTLEDPLQIRLPICGLIAVTCLRVGYSFLAYRQRREYIGAGLLAVGFWLWGLFHLGFPFLYYVPELLGAGYAIATVLQLFIAVSMIILVLEDSRHAQTMAFANLGQQTEAKAALRSQAEATEERYRSLFENAGEPIIIAEGEDLRTLEINRAATRLLGLAAPPPAGQPLLDYCANLPPGNAGAIERLRALRPLQIKRADGSVAPVEVNIMPIRYGDRPAVQMFFHELTERAQLEQQLRQAEKLAALGQMISGIAHELNNPLTVVKGYVELILHHRQLEPEVRAELQKVAHESNRAAKLVKNFLAFAREHPPQREMINLNELTERVLELRKFAVRVAGVEVVANLEPALPATLADADQIQQVLVILVNNALQAMSANQTGGRLAISTRLENQRIVLRVNDNGPGVPPHLEQKIFEPFFSTKEVGSGTGLGLSIAHSILVEHQGKIRHERPAEGGACFVVELPLVTGEPAVAAGGSTPAAASEPETVVAPGLEVLVLDDEPAIAELVREMLRILGCRATSCTNPHEALELLKNGSFSIIFSDIRMPTMDGRQFYAAVRQQDPKLAERIIFLTGDTVNEETRVFLQTVGNLHVGKPFQFEALRDAVQKQTLVTACRSI